MKHKTPFPPQEVPAFMLDGRQLNYLPGAIRLAVAEAQAGRQTIIDIYHDDACPAVNGGGCCTCNPEMVARVTGYLGPVGPTN